MTANQNLEALYSYAHFQKINIDKEEYKFQVETHPDYPSLLAFADALTFFNIPNVAFKIPFEEIENLPNSFIVLLNSNLVHITKKENFYHYSEDKKQIKATKEELKELWQEVVLLAEAPEEHTEKSISKISATVFIGILVVFLLGSVYFFTQNLLFAIFGLLPAIGLFLSIEALKTELGIESKISQTFCNAIPNADCGQVINSSKNKWMQKVKISDISFWFFASQLLAIFIFSVAQLSSHFFSIMLVGLALSLPMTLYSIYFQYKIEKKWCPICLSIIGVVYLEFAFLLFLYNGFYANTVSLALFTSIFSLIAGLVYLLKPIFLEKKDISEKYIKQLRFSRNYEIFKNTLVKSETQFFDKEYIVLGNRESKHKISVVTSPLCGYCKDAHTLLDKIYHRFGNDIGISIRFNFDENSTNKNLFLRLAEIYEAQGDVDFMFALKDWFENKNLDNWLNKFGNFENTDGIENKLIEITNENKEKELNFTPNIFLNQYNYPEQYERENLEYFIADWLEDEEL